MLFRSPSQDWCVTTRTPGIHVRITLSERSHIGDSSNTYFHRSCRAAPRSRYADGVSSSPAPAPRDADSRENTTQPNSASAPPTLRELLDEPTLRLGRHEAVGAAVDSVVRWVHSTELAEPAPYLRGGELVCTVGTILEDPRRCVLFVQSVSGAGAAGICFGVGDVHDHVPDALVRACRRAGLPLLTAPLGAPFSAISEYVASRRMQAETSRLRSREALMPQLLSGLRARLPVGRLLAEAAWHLGGRITLRVDDEPVTAGKLEGGDNPARVVSARVRGHGDLVWERDAAFGDDDALEQVCRVVEVALGERDVEAALRRERVGQLLLLAHDRMLNPTALLPHLEAAGLVGARLVVAAWPAGAAGLLGQRLSNALVGEAPSVSLTVTATDDDVRTVAAQLAIPCGYGSPVPVAQLGQGLSQARAALELAFGQGGLVGPAGLTSLEGLLEQQPVGRLDPFIGQLISPLVESDRRRGTEHIGTLRSFLANNGSLQRTAREQYLHVNTVRHRLARVRELTGRDPLQFSDRVALVIGLWAYDRQGPDGEPGSAWQRS